MSKFHVLGLGPSLSDFVPDSNPTIGCNDIWNYYPADYVVCIDKPFRFNEKRLASIKSGGQKKFFTHVQEWKEIVDNYTTLELSLIRGNLSDLHNEKVPYSNNSAFVAVVLAYRMGAKEIIMYGVDLSDHHQLGKPEILKKACEDFRNLFLALHEKGVRLCVINKKSILSNYIPVYNSSGK